MKPSINRRRFMKAAAAAAGLPLFTARSYSRIMGANNRLHTALIGCGGMGRAHLNALLSMKNEENVDIDLVCDVYQTRAQAFADLVRNEGGSPRVVVHHEDVLDASGLDYVTIVVPEHNHAHIALDALDAGLHVYCEKPLALKTGDAFTLVRKARESGKKVQVGVQGMSDDSYASAAEAIRAGKIGPVIQAQIDYVRRYPLNQGPWRLGVDLSDDKPADLDWKRWLGPAPARAWSAPRYYEWRNYKDYSGGIAGDLFVHRLTRIVRSCGLTFPSSVAAMGGILLWNDGRELPDNLEAILTYPAVEGISPGMTVHLLGTMGNGRGNEHLIRGYEASLKFTQEGWEIISEESGEAIERHVKTGGEKVDLHHKNHHAAIRSGAALACPPELGLYGVVAINGIVESWEKRKLLSWDSARTRWT